MTSVNSGIVGHKFVWREKFCIVKQFVVNKINEDYFLSLNERLTDV